MKTGFFAMCFFYIDEVRISMTLYIIAMKHTTITAIMTKKILFAYFFIWIKFISLVF